MKAAKPMFFVGVEHGTRSIRCTIIDNTINDKDLFTKTTEGSVPTFGFHANFEIRRGKGEVPSFLSLLGERVALEEIALLWVTIFMRSFPSGSWRTGASRHLGGPDR